MVPGWQEVLASNVTSPTTHTCFELIVTALRIRLSFAFEVSVEYISLLRSVVVAIFLHTLALEPPAQSAELCFYQYQSLLPKTPRRQAAIFPDLAFR